MAVTLPGNQADREGYLREHRATKFIDAVGDARRDSVILTIDAFAGEPETLYVALDYASNAGVTLTIAPAVPSDRTRPSA
jgi:hypothetical protein